MGNYGDWQAVESFQLLEIGYQWMVSSPEMVGVQPENNDSKDLVGTKLQLIYVKCDALSRSTSMLKPHRVIRLYA